MAKTNPWIVILGALAVGGFIWALTEKSKRIAAETKTKEIQQDYLKLLSLYLSKQKDLPEEIKNQLVHLRENFIGIHDSIAIELMTIIEELEGRHEEIAIEKLTKVIENLLKEKYVEAGLAKDKRSCPKLSQLLDKALSLKWISKNEFYFSNFLRTERNDEAHDLAVRFPKNWKMISFLAGIEILYNIKGIPRMENR